MSKTYIKDMKDKDHVEDVFLVKNKTTPLAKNGKAYLAMSLGDKTGSVEARMWDGIESVITRFQRDDFIKVKGVVNLYQKRLQLVVTEIAKVSKKDIKPEDFLPSTKHDVEAMFKHLIMIVKGLNNKYVRQLILNTLEDPVIKPKYMRCPAARTIHHGWIGGLLEHTLSICKLMVFLASHYEGIDLNLLIFGAIFHDIGKIWELDFEMGTNYTDAGKLIGHLVMGSELVEAQTQKIKGFPEELKIICKHIILSHHGKYEYGSPKRPKLLEAYIVSSIDELDSKITALQSFLQNEKALATGNQWTGYSAIFDRYFFMPRTNQEVLDGEPKTETSTDL